MRFIRFVVGVLISGGFLFCLPVLGGSGRTEAFILAIERIKHSVVPVVCGKFDDKGQFALQLIDGTGFFIDTQGHFVTAGHVIRGLSIVNAQQPVPCIDAVYVPDNAWQRDAITFNSHWFKFGDCEIDDSIDVAVCKTIDIPQRIEAVTIADVRPSDGSPVAFTGFPLGSQEPLSSRCDIATYRAATDSEGSRELVLDKGTWPGASGSPIYREDGSVIGILLQRGIADGTGIAVGRPSHFILQFLAAHKINLTKAKQKK
jgi:S1-C subfamily serine protease